MDYRTGTLAVRALGRGADRFVAAVDAAADFDAEAFADFARRGNVREWLTPLVDDERARSRLTAPFVRELSELRDAQPGVKRTLIAAAAEARDAFEAAGIPLVFLKGLGVASRFYADIHRRHQYDIDLLVRPEHFEPAIETIGSLGFDTDGERVASRRRKIRERSVARAPQTITVRRADGVEIDLHCRTKSRWFPGQDEEAFWADPLAYTVGGETFRGPNDATALLFLTLSLCLDVRRGAARVKHFLDLFLMLRSLDASTDWDAELDAHRRDGLLRPLATVWTMLLVLWRCADELPRLARALGKRRRAIRLVDPTEALRLVERPRGSPWNRAWFLSVHRLSTWTEMWGARYQYAFHRLARLLRPRERGEGWPWAGLGTDERAADLPTPILDLLGREGLEVAGVEEITALPGRTGSRSTHRVRLVDGREVKARVQPADVIAFMRRIIPLLDDTSFPRVLAASGVATLEEWRDGRPIEDDAETLAAAGAILGRVHTLDDPEPIGWDDERLRDLGDRMAGWLERLRRAGALTDDEAAALSDRIDAGRPPQATWGIVHLDFCRENLVRTDHGLCCVDNATVRPGARAFDLAQTFYRWPLTEDGRAAFLEGYSRHADPAPCIAHEPFWAIAAALRSAAFRLAEGTPDVDTPLRRLRAAATGESADA